MRSTISMKLIIKLLLIICACWTTTTLAIELPSHENQQLRLEDAKPIIVLPWEVIDELQLSQRRPKSPPPPRRSPSPPPPRRSPPPPPPRSPPPPPPRRSPPPPPPRSPPPPPMRSPPPPAPLAPPPSWESPPPTPMASPPPPTPLAPPPPKIIYPIVTFDLLGANSITYNQFVFDLRENLRSPDNLAYFGIPMIRNPCTIFDFNRFLLVQLIGLKHSTTLALRVRDGSLVGYCRSHDPTTAWFFDDTTEDEKALLFQDEDVEHQSLGFEGNYDSLGGRNDVLINPAVIDFSITTLSRTKSEEDMTEVKRSLLIITQVVSEAARFQYIAGPVAKTMDSFFYQYVLDARARSYQDNWITLSEEVANSIGLGGAFRNPVVLADENGLVIEYIGFVWQIVNDVSLLAFVAT